MKRIWREWALVWLLTIFATTMIYAQAYRQVFPVGSYFIKTQVLSLRPILNPQIVPGYDIITTSEGPFTYDNAKIRQKQIAIEGLDLGQVYIPVHLVQKVIVTQ